MMLAKLARFGAAFTSPLGVIGVLRRHAFRPKQTHVLPVATLFVWIFTPVSCVSLGTDAMFQLFTVLFAGHVLQVAAQSVECRGILRSLQAMATISASQRTIFINMITALALKFTGWTAPPIGTFARESTVINKRRQLVTRSFLYEFNVPPINHSTYPLPSL